MAENPSPSVSWFGSGWNAQAAVSVVVMEEKEGWYRYGDSNPGSMAENHVS